ncbi:cell division protein, FtsW/RodA/SpoVE family, partial [Streptococcus agalactiae CJB111]
PGATTDFFLSNVIEELGVIGAGFILALVSF